MLSVPVLSDGATRVAESVCGTTTATRDGVVPGLLRNSRSIAMPSTRPAASSALQPNTTVRDRRRGASGITVASRAGTSVVAPARAARRAAAICAHIASRGTLPSGA